MTSTPPFSAARGRHRRATELARPAPVAASPSWDYRFQPRQADQEAGLAMLQTLATTAPLPTIPAPRAPALERTNRVPAASPAVRGPVVARSPVRGDRRPVRRRRQADLAARQERVGHLAEWKARRKVGPLFFGMTVTYAAFGWWALRHVDLVEDVTGGRSSRAPFAMAYSLVFLLLVWQMTAAFLERPIKRRRGENDQLWTVVTIPVYNEDPQLLADCLDSLLSQSRRANQVFVTDDGSSVDYTGVRARFEAEAEALDVHVTWVRTVNRGKRHAQAEAFANTPTADIYITVDSDAILDFHAIEEAMKPFADSRVQSVAGVLLLANNKKNLITRTSELWYVCSELIDRSALSAMSSVLVNTGTFALYRAEVIRENLNGYVNETFFGRPVQFSDDSLLTFYAKLKGRAVQQPTAFGFTAMPENLSHHFRQYLRWMRGMTIRTFWRFKYLPVASYVYWNHFFRWIQVFITLPLFVLLFAVEPAETHHFDPRIILVPLLVGYGRSLRYLTIRRYDEPWWSQVLTYLLAPLVAMWTYTVLRALWWYGMATCLRTGWGTRQNGVEVSLDAS